MGTLVVVDPGMSTGIVIGYYDDTTPLRIDHKYQITGGLKGFVAWTQSPDAPMDFEWNEDTRDLEMSSELVMEKFTPRDRKDGGGLTLKSIEPVRIEGYAVGVGYIPDYFDDQRQWRQPAEQYWTGGSNLRDKKKRAQMWLKKHELWTTGSQVGQPDADDVNSAMMHTLGYMRDIMHLPTLTKYFKD